jgi:rfaE bifunctional protein nucleotidyltransferase chain/domain
MRSEDSQDLSPPAFLGKIHDGARAATALALLPRPWVFTNGVFDILHRGHVTYLAQARSLGGSLVVGLNTDASARRLGKGPDRPLHNEEDRAVMMAALQSVDLVTWFDEDTPIELIRTLRPDIIVKGGDYDMSKLPETAVVESWGGRALAIPFVQGYSTTSLVRRIRAPAS